MKNFSFHVEHFAQYVGFFLTWSYICRRGKVHQSVMTSALAIFLHLLFLLLFFLLSISPLPPPLFFLCLYIHIFSIFSKQHITLSNTYVYVYVCDDWQIFQMLNTNRLLYAKKTKSILHCLLDPHIHEKNEIDCHRMSNNQLEYI